MPVWPSHVEQPKLAVNIVVSTKVFVEINAVSFRHALRRYRVMEI